MLSDEVAEDVPERLLEKPNFPGVRLKPSLPTRTRAELTTRDRVVYEKSAGHFGAMVALRIPLAAAKQVALGDHGAEKPEDLHVTLVYLGDAGDLDPDKLEDLHRRLAALAARTPPLEGRLAGAGRFRDQQNEQDVLWVGLDSPDLAELRHAVLGAIRDSALEPAGDHGFTPHVTLAFVGEGEGEDPEPPDIPVRVKHLTVAVGGREVAYRLAGDPEGSAEEPERVLPAETFSQLQRPAGPDFRSVEQLEEWAQRKGALLVRADVDGAPCVVVKKGRDVSVAVPEDLAREDGTVLAHDLVSALGRVDHDYVVSGYLSARDIDGKWLPPDRLADVLDARVVANPIFLPCDVLAMDGDLADRTAGERWEILRALVPEAGGHVVVPPQVLCRADQELEVAVDECLAWRPSEGEGLRVVGVTCVRAESTYTHGETDDEARLDVRPESERLRKYSDDQPRNELGMWTSGTGAGDVVRPEHREAVAAVRAAGARYDGVQETSDTAAPLIQYTDPVTGTTMSIRPEEATEAEVRARLGAKRALFAEHRKDFGFGAGPGPGEPPDWPKRIPREHLDEPGFLHPEKDALTTAGASGILAPEQGVFRKPNRSRYMNKEEGPNVSVGVPLTLVPTRQRKPRGEDDPGGPLFPHYTPGAGSSVHKDRGDNPRDESGRWTSGGAAGTGEDKAHTFGGNLAISHKVDLTLQTDLSDKKSVHISDLEVPRERRGKGVGSIIMRKITQYADRHGLRLTLDPEYGGVGSETTSRGRLVRFYRQFGFVENKGRHADESSMGEMYRLPQIRKQGFGSVSGGGTGDGDSFSVGPGVVGAHRFVVGTLKDGVMVGDPLVPRVNPYEAIFLRRCFVGDRVGKYDDRFRAEEETANPDSRKPRRYPDVGEEMGWSDSYLEKDETIYLTEVEMQGPPATGSGERPRGDRQPPSADGTLLEKYDESEPRDEAGRWTGGGSSIAIPPERVAEPTKVEEFGGGRHVLVTSGSTGLTADLHRAGNSLERREDSATVNYLGAKLRYDPGTDRADPPFDIGTNRPPQPAETLRTLRAFVGYLAEKHPEVRWVYAEAEHDSTARLMGKLGEYTGRGRLYRLPVAGLVGKSAELDALEKDRGDNPRDERGRWTDSGGGTHTGPTPSQQARQRQGVMWKVDEPDAAEPTDEEKRGVDGKVRLGRCYDQAGRYVMDRVIGDRMEPGRGSKIVGVTLVHGTVTIGQRSSLGGVAIGHGWVEIKSTDGSEKVYDGVQGAFYQKASYYESMRAVDEHRYTPEEAVKMMLKTKNFGPWERTAGLTKGPMKFADGTRQTAGDAKDALDRAMGLKG